MIIESLDIRRFGRLTDFKAAFDRGFNLIEGPAESGKSTLAAFLVYMLYGFPAKATEGVLDERTLRAPWDGGEAEGSMVFSVRGVRYRISRSSALTKEGYRDTYLLLNLDTGVSEEGGTVPGERFLGVSYETFLDTATLSDVRRGGPDERGITSAIESILFSGDERLSSEGAVRALSEAAHEIAAERCESGAVAVLEKEKALLEEELAEAIAKERLHFKREEELFLTRRKMEEARAEVEKFVRLETNFYNALMIEDYDRLHALEDSSDSRVAAIRAHEGAYRAADFLPDRDYLFALANERAETVSAKREETEAENALSALPDAKTVISTDEAALIACVERASGEEALCKNEKNCLQRSIRDLIIGALCSLCLIAFIVALVVSRTSTTLAVLFGGGAVLALGASVLFFVEGIRNRRRLRELYDTFAAVGREDFLLGVRRAAEAKLRGEHADAERERARVRLSRATERRILAEKALANRLARWGVSLNGAGSFEDTVDEVLSRGEDFLYEDERLRAEHKAAEAEVVALRKKLEGQNEVAVRARVAPDDRKRYRNQNANDLRHGVEMYTERLETLIEDEKTLVSALAAEETPEDDSATIAERIMALDARIGALLETARVLRMARDAVAGGEERLRREISPRLGLDACRHLYEMTDGKYSDLAVSDGMHLSFDEGEGARAVAYLSHSTEDLTYYALRFALISLLYRESPPVCLDGCTARQDDERALSFLRAVRTLCEEGRQCFFFASGSRERELVLQVFSTFGRIVMKAN